MRAVTLKAICAPERYGDETRLRGLALRLQRASNQVRVGGLCGPQALQARFQPPALSHCPHYLVLCMNRPRSVTPIHL